MGDPRRRKSLVTSAILSQDEWHAVLRDVLAQNVNRKTVQTCIDALAQARRDNDWRAVMVVERMLQAELAPSDRQKP